MNTSSNIKNGIFYNSNPDSNPRAIALWSLGEKKVKDIVWLHGLKYRVVETGLRVRHNGKLYRHGIKVETVKGGYGDILVNANEASDFNSVWVN